MGEGAYGSFKFVFHSFLSSLVTQNFYFLYCKYKTVATMGKWIKLKGHKKKANADVDRKKATYESTKSKMFCNCVGTWWCDESTKLLTFQFFYCCDISKP